MLAYTCTVLLNHERKTFYCPLALSLMQFPTQRFTATDTTSTCLEWTGREDVLVIATRITRDKNSKLPSLKMLYNNICDQLA